MKERHISFGTQNDKAPLKSTMNDELDKGLQLRNGESSLTDDDLSHLRKTNVNLNQGDHQKQISTHKLHFLPQMPNPDDIEYKNKLMKLYK